MSMKTKGAAALLALLPAACTVGPRGAAGSHGRPAVAATAVGCDPERDRAAIRAMAGEYDVSFSFQETEPLAAGYQLREPYRTGGTEMILVAEESPTRVSLQHILLIEHGGKSMAMKHWRQDWTYQDREVLEYRGGQRWARRLLASDQVRCGWSQAVFEVNDGPRYESWGRWVHAGETSTWTSGDTWRPLPRREYSHRSDYDVLAGVNRHIVTPSGWVHEQDNTKLVLRGDLHPLVRERGLNRYRRSDEHDFGAVREYWRRTEPFWRDVRGAWQDVLQGQQNVVLRSNDPGKPLHQELAALMDDPATAPLRGGESRRAQIESMIRRHLEAEVRVTQGTEKRRR
jgi:hypothetical protein